MYRNETSEYFNARMAAEEMKSLYKRLVKQYHPDLNPGISDEHIKKINNEFSFWYARAATTQVREEKKAANPDKTEYYDNHYTVHFAESLEEMIKWVYAENIDRLPNITVEIIGVFIWISGIRAEDKEIRTKVKMQGFDGGWKEQNNKESVYMWKWTPEKRRFRSDPNIDNIRNRYGSQDMKRYTNRLGS